jgi:methylisocitrate lyase
MCAKLRAAAGAKTDPDLVILARTDARGVTDINDAIERAKRYLEAGADWIFPEALQSKAEFEQFAGAIDAPLVANMTEFGKGPLLTLEELADLGYSAVLYPVTLLRVSMKACEAALNLLAADGTQSDILDLMQTREELYDLLEYQAFEQRDQAHAKEQKAEEPKNQRANF